MKPIHILAFAALIVLLLATALILSAFHQPMIPVTGVDPLSMQNKITAFQTDDLSEVGSTTGIFIMGAVILLIVAVPMLARKKKH
ncbi:MAG: hypothetical protein JNM55_05905 [Anaerolineales bacterium]|nr:hypothetical protein [Anaerolineales bacterium]